MPPGTSVTFPQSPDDPATLAVMPRVLHAAAGVTGLVTVDVVVGRPVTGPLHDLPVELRAAALLGHPTRTAPARADRTGAVRRPTGERER